MGMGLSLAITSRSRSNVQKESHKSAIEWKTDLSYYAYFMERNMFFADVCR